MNRPVDEIPNLERLMRQVVRQVTEAALGVDWLDKVGKSVRDGITRAAELARSQRPREALVDDWEAAGVGEIAALLNARWQDVGSGLASVWPNRESATVDLERLRRFRGRTLHAVGTPPSAPEEAEIGAMVQRLRLAFESVRRSLASSAGEWWPYIEAIHSNIPQLNWVRGKGSPIAKLIEGDHVELQVVAVHPEGRAEDLRYNFEVIGASGAVPAQRGADPKFEFDMPVVRLMNINVRIADRERPAAGDVTVLRLSARPAP